jgi:kinesin family protein 1
VLDTSSTYVRGEENLQGWRPRGDSLIIDHQWELEKLTRLEMVEKSRHVLLLREKLSEQNRTQELSKLDKEASNLFKQARSQRDKEKLTDAEEAAEKRHLLESTASLESECDRDKELTQKCLQLMMQGRTAPQLPTPKLMESSLTESLGGGTSEEPEAECDKLSNSSTSDSLNRPASPEPKKSLSTENLSMAAEGQMVAPPRPEGVDQNEVLYVPEVEEIRVSPVVSRKGYLNFLEEKTNGWVKRFVVVRRPYVYLYNSEKDPVERGLINLATAQVEFSEEGQAIITARNTFSVMTKHRAFLLQTIDEKDIHDWLYAINPLLAGQIRSKLSRRKQTLRI